MEEIIWVLYIKQQINWDSFCEFSEIINRIFIQDLHILCKRKNRDIDLIFSREDEVRAERLYSIGLIGMYKLLICILFLIQKV